MESEFENLELVHPNWPTIWPRLLTDGKLKDNNEQNQSIRDIIESQSVPLSNKVKQYLWECEKERFTYKACLRKVIGLRRSSKHTSWNTAEVANLQLTYPCILLSIIE